MLPTVLGPGNPCPDREVSYLGRVSCRPVDAVTRAVLPAAAIGAALGAMVAPGPQYWTPLRVFVAKGAGAGALGGGVIAATAYTKKSTGSDLAAGAVATLGTLGVLYVAVRGGAIPMP